MNAVTTPPVADEATEETAPVTLEDALASVDDGSRLAENVSIEEVAEPMFSAARILKVAVTKATDARKALAASMAAARRSSLLVSGAPDWAGITRTYNAFVEKAYDIAFEGMSKDVRRREINAVKQHLHKTYIELAIREYVAHSVTLNGEPAFDLDEDGEVKPDDIERYNALVRLAYIGQGNAAEPDVAIPLKYQTPGDKERGSSGGNPAGEGPKDALSAARKGIDGLKSVVPLMVARVLLIGVSSLTMRIAEQGAIEERQKVGGYMERIAGLALYAAAVCENDAKAEDAEVAKSLLWTAEDEKNDTNPLS